MMLTELLFADDTAAVATSRESIERTALVLDEVLTKAGAEIGCAKDKTDVHRCTL